MNETAYDRLVGALRQYGYRLRDNGQRAESQCPAHPDRQASMSITGIEGQVLVHCHAGCETADIVAAVDLTLADLYDDKKGATYRYASGRVVHRSVDKKFYQTGDTKIFELYRAERLTGLDKDKVIYLVEGEKDVHAIESLDAVAVTAPQGATNFGKVNVEPLRGRHVIAVVDRPTKEGDHSGQTWAGDVQTKLTGLAASIRYVQAAAGKDAADHIAAGLPLDAFASIDPPAAQTPAGRHLVGLEVPRIARITHWVWGENHTGWIPRGALTLLAGREGGGKSTVLAKLAADITRGRLPGVYEGQPKTVLYAATEDSWAETITPRLIAAGADMNLILQIHAVGEDGAHDKMNLPVDTRRIPDLVGRLSDPGVAVLMLDPVLSFLDDNISTNRAQELRTALEPLARAAEQARIGVIGLVHFNKSQDTDVNSMIAGSRAWVEVARSVLASAYDNDNDRYVLAQTKNSRGRKTEAITYTLVDTVVEGVDDHDQPADVHIGRAVWGEQTDTDPETLLQRRNPNRGGGNRQNSAADQILQFLASRLDRGWSPGQIADETLLAQGTVRRVLSELRNRNRVRQHHGLYWMAEPPTDEVNAR